MTQVDFYVLGPGAAGNRWTLACRLAEKAYQQGRRVLVHTGSQQDAREIDRLLWTFRDGSFVPHGLWAETDRELTPVLIAHQGEADEEHDVLINLASDVPAFFSRFERVAEPLDREQAGLDAGRRRFRFYRDRGYPLNHHDIDQ
ncbi:MAG: DNA polymerase III subunit chi [Chromatiales bacterium]|jgi:DNA polymerase-3 subunit chi